MFPKILLIFFIFSVAANCFLLYQAIKYRDIVVARNSGYQDLTPFPVYRNDNHTLNLLSVDSSLYYDLTVFIGSSIIQRWDFEAFFHEHIFINRGIGDDTTDGIKNRFDNDVISLKPNLAVIFICSNDVKYQIPSARSKENLEHILTLCREKGIIPVVFTALPVVYSFNPSLLYSRPENEMRSLEKALISLCNQMNVTCINLREQFESKDSLESYYLKDGIHLNENGYKLLSEIVMNTIQVR